MVYLVRGVLATTDVVYGEELELRFHQSFAFRFIAFAVGVALILLARFMAEISVPRAIAMVLVGALACAPHVRMRWRRRRPYRLAREMRKRCPPHEGVLLGVPERLAHHGSEGLLFDEPIVQVRLDDGRCLRVEGKELLFATDGPPLRNGDRVRVFGDFPVDAGYRKASSPVVEGPTLIERVGDPQRELTDPRGASAR